MKIYHSRDGQKNIAQIRKTAREWARKHPRLYFWNDSRRETQRRYRAKYKDKIAVKRRAYFHKKLETDVQYRLMWLLRSRVMIALKSNLAYKAYKTIELLGCPIEIAREHLEKQFKDGMSWKNHGEWEIDHIIPISSFDLTKPEQQKKAFHYTNLQPLIKLENRIKSSRMVI